MRDMEVNDFVEISSPVKRDQEIANNFGEVDIITECLSEEQPDCTSNYTNKLFEHNLLHEQTTHMINGKVLEEVGSQNSNANLRAPDSPYHTNKENDTKYGFAEDKDKHFDGDSSHGVNRLH